MLNTNNPRCLELLESAVLHLRSELLRHAPPNGWRRAFVEFRGKADDTIIYKLRLVRPDGRVVAMIGTPLEYPPQGVMDSFYPLWKLRKTAFDRVWHGLKISIDREGQEKIEYNFDPDCASDPTYWDD